MDSECVPDDSAIIQMNVKRDEPPLTVEFRISQPGCLADDAQATNGSTLVLRVFDARANLLSMVLAKSDRFENLCSTVHAKEATVYRVTGTYGITSGM